jgi:disease resistance protein RPM1
MKEACMFTLYIFFWLFIILHKYTGSKATKDVYSKKDWDSCFKIIKGICQGLLFLHKLDIPIIHMDLKPENILLGENMVPKIADFALSRLFGQEQTRLCTQTVVGS